MLADWLVSTTQLNALHGPSSGTVSMRPHSTSSSFYISAISPEANFDIVAPNYRIHRSMLESSVGGRTTFEPIAHIALTNATTPTRINDSSSQSMLQTAQQAYDVIEKRLSKLAGSQNEDAAFETGAAESALKVVRSLYQHHYPPPELAKQGGDAIVMLWALGDTTCAITVTNGELGYVVRRGRKAIRLEDSIAVDSFRLEGLR